METLQQFFPNYYRDSVALMQLSGKIAGQEGVLSASAQMATAANIDMMVNAGLLTESVAAKPNDLLIVIKADNAGNAELAMEFAKTSLNEVKKVADSNGAIKEPPRSTEMALKENPELNLVLISTPGEFAAAEALKALKQGLNVMMFSDNVSVEQEVMLKKYASEHDLLVMGPDCGTAIIGGVPLAFANVVNAGTISVIGASGTGIQQITCLVDQMGSGIKHAIGTGGHDLSEAVGGLTMLSALDLLEQDDATKTIVLVSKPPAPEVAQKILDKAKTLSKPIVVNFLGANRCEQDGNLYFVKTLEDAAVKAVQLDKGEEKSTSNFAGRIEKQNQELDEKIAKLAKTQIYLRGLYAGGTFCYEAQLLTKDAMGICYSNTPVKGANKLTDIWKSQQNTIIDLGDDDFTRGRPHPMIDPSTRNERILKEASDPQTAVILFDLVLGYGAHENPAAELVKVIIKAKETAQKEGRFLIFVGFICGTDKDPQDYQKQRQALTQVDVVLADSNAHAAEIASYIMSKIISNEGKI